jgi:hypothetical protein
MLLFLGTSLSSFSQYADFLAGYGIGTFGRGMNNIENEIYRFNHFKFPGIKSEMNTPSFFHGFDFGLLIRLDDEDRFYFSWDWTNKHMVSSGSGIHTNGKDMDLSLKVRHNNLNICAFGYRFKPWIGVAYSPMDFGNIKVLYKNSAEDGYSSYKDFYNVEKGLLSDYTVYGYSLYLDLFLKDRFRFRVHWYRTYNGVGLRDKDNILKSNHYNPENLSFSLCYMFHKKR